MVFTAAKKLSIFPWTNHRWKGISAEKSGRITACFQLFMILHVVKKNVRKEVQGKRKD